ncbi:MAG TPA: type II secretion system F family protein [Dehalococcoidia bacterium]|nr:type II secretion system F family protein [Dehalococcoidia bacterium]
MDITALAAAVFVMGAIFTGFYALYRSTANPRSQLERRLGHVIGESTGFDITPADAVALRQTRTGHLPLLGPLLEGKEWTAAAAIELDRADMRLTVSEFVAVRIFMGLAAATGVVLFMGSGIVGVIVGVVAGFIGYQAPKVYMKRKQSSRLNKLNDQLVEGLGMLANSLKAGFGLMQSMDMLTREMPHPFATEIRRTLHDINIGSTTEEALQSMAERCGSKDLDIVITAMLIQQSTGGNLAEILDTVAHTMRERIRIRGEIKTLTAQQMLSGVIIGALPVFIAGAVMVINPSYIEPLFTRLAGQVMLGGALMMEMFGVFLIKRILAIEV